MASIQILAFFLASTEWVWDAQSPPLKRIPIMLDNIDKLEVSEIDEMIETLAAEKARRQEEE